MPNKKIIKETALTNKKEAIIKRYKIMSISFSLALFFLILLPTVVLFFTISGNPNNDIGPIIMVISFTGTGLSLIAFLYAFFKGPKHKYGKTTYFSNDDKHAFIKKYLAYLPLRLTLIFAALFLMIFGLYVKNINGIICTYCGLIVLMVGLCFTSYVEINKSMYKESKYADDKDIILSNSVFYNLTLVERTILSVSLIIIAILTFNLYAQTLNTVFEIILMVLAIATYLYNFYICIKLERKYKNLRK